jgi:hypothetical protein
MFGIGSKLRRIGTTPHKVQMSIDVKIVTANDGALMASSCSSVFVEFVRGSNSVTSTRREWPDTGAATLQFEETLTLVMTLYQNKDGTYQDKKGKLVLKGVSKQTQSTDTLGSAELKLHVLAANFETQRVQLELLDKGRRPMGKVNVTTTAKFLGEGKDDDDSSVASSVHSAQQHQGGFPDFGMHHRPLQPTAVGASSTAHSHPELIARYNNYDRPNVPAAASSGFNNSLPAVRTVANDDDSALSSLRAKRGLPAAPAPAPAPAHYPTPAPMPTTVAATAPGPVAAKAAASAAPAAPAASAAAPARSAPRAGEDDRDREIQRLRQQLEATNERQNTLEGEFQSKITAMVCPTLSCPPPTISRLTCT